MSLILGKSILLSICCVYTYVRLVMSSYLLFCCIYSDAMCITCFPNEKKLKEFTKSDSVYQACYTLMLGVSHVVEVLVLDLLVV